MNTWSRVFSAPFYVNLTFWENYGIIDIEKWKGVAMLTNCKNCGAPIHYGVCEYCGTDYREPHHIYFNFTPPRPYKRTDWAETSINDAIALTTSFSLGVWDYYGKYYNKPTPIKTVRTN